MQRGAPTPFVVGGAKHFALTVAAAGCSAARPRSRGASNRPSVFAFPAGAVRRDRNGSAKRGAISVQSAPRSETSTIVGV